MHFFRQRKYKSPFYSEEWKYKEAALAQNGQPQAPLPLNWVKLTFLIEVLI